MMSTMLGREVAAVANSGAARLKARKLRVRMFMDGEVEEGRAFKPGLSF